MTWKFRPRPHRHDPVECWCEPTPPAPIDWDRVPLAGFCAHGVGMLDDCPQCCPPKAGE